MMKNISKINLNLITEKLYTESLINQYYNEIAYYGEGESGVKSLMESIIKEEKGKHIINDIVTEFKLAPKFIFSFGTGIAAFYGPVEKLLSNSQIILSEYEIYLLIITAIASLINESNLPNLIEKLKSEGIYSSLQNVKEFLLNTKELVDSVSKNVLGTTYSITDILGFTALLMPTMSLLSDIINQYDITSKNLNLMLKGVILSASVYGVKSIIKRIKNKLS
jgi:hypothetical protein